jgi:polysaccharide biosynthesis protein PslH
MKVLFVSAVLPWPLSSGGQVRSYELLKRLGKNHSITLATFFRNNNDTVGLNHLPFIKHILHGFRGHAWQLPYIINSIVGQYPFLTTTYDNTNLRLQIEYELDTQSYDLIHIEPHYIYSVLPHTYAQPIVVCEHNIEYAIYESFANQTNYLLRPFLLYEAHRMKIFEENIWEKANRIIAVSESDAEIISQYNKNTSVVPNCVDAQKYPWIQKNLQKNRLRILFVGDFKWMQNRDALSTIVHTLWPKIVSAFPYATLTIVGKELPNYMKKDLMQPSMSYLGFVDNIQTIYKTNDVLLCPIAIGGGTKYKLLEAFASGLPVIASKKSIEGLSVFDKKELCIAEKPEEYVSALKYMIHHPKFILSMTKKARQLVESNYSWDKAAYDMEKVWNEVVM